VRDHETGARRSPASRSLRRTWWLPLLLALIGAGVGGWVGLHRPHEASATVLVNPLVGNPFSPTGTGEDLLNLESEAQLVASDRVARAVADDLGSTGDPRDLLGGLTVTVPSNTQTLEVTFSASSAKRAVQRAQAFAENYLVVRSDRAQALVDRQSRLLRTQIGDAQRESERLTDSRETIDDPAALASVDAQIQTTLDRQQQLQQSLQELTQSVGSPGDVVNSAVATKPFGPLPAVAVFGGLGLVAFLVLGLALALLRTRSGSRVRHPDDVDAYGLPVLGTVARKSAARSRVMLLNGEPTTPDSSTAGGQVMSTVRTAVLTHRQRALPITVLLGTASVGTSASAVSAAGLARSLAQSNLRVVLVDLGDGSVAGAPNLPSGDGSERPGLLEVLQGTADVDDAVRKLGNGIELVTAGTDPSAVRHLLVNPRMESVLTALESRSDLVLVAAASLHDPAVQSLFGRVDTVLIEVNEGDTRLRDVARLAGLDGLAEELAGVVYVASSDHRA
jgi:polysaccharide biosynthesis transport protein